MTRHIDRNDRTLAIALIGVGALFLISEIFSFSIFGLLWPLLIIAPGLPFIYYAVNGERHLSGLMIPGLLISGLGSLLFYQNLTGNWESWAYAWLLFPALVGFGIQYIGHRMEQSSAYHVGRTIARSSLMVLAGLGLIFVFGGLGGLTGLLIPAALVAGGVMLLRREPAEGAVSLGRRRKRVSLDAEPEKRKNGYEAIDPELRRKIDAALAEEDPPTE
jgi:hypothetical protein